MNKHILRPVRRGYSLVEIVIYVALLGIFAVVMANSLLRVVATYQTARASREVASNARLLVDELTGTIREATEVYTPTSRFNVSLGQLSLVTASGADANHTTIYIDYWVDNGRLWMRREGSAAIPLSTPSVRVNAFSLERVIETIGKESVRITLGLGSNTPLRFAAATTTLNISASLRGNY